MTTLRSAKVLAFNRPMASPASESPQQTPQTETTPVATQIHGNTSQRLSAFFAGGALIVSLIGTGLTVTWHFSDRSDKQSDEHIKTLIGDQIKPLNEIAKDDHISALIAAQIKPLNEIAKDDHISALIAAQIKPLNEIAKDDHINALIAAQIKPLNESIGKIAQDVAFLKGQAHDANVKLEKLRRPDPQMQAQSSNPDRALTGIRATLEQAQDEKKLLPEPTIVEYTRKIQTIATSATDYWTTVAAIINYQSYVNQRERNAPDPFEVSKPCQFVTQGPNSTHNVIQGSNKFKGCVVDLDGTTNEVDGAVFENSVIYWHGGEVTIKLATFVNCRFVLDIKGEPSHPDFLRQLLANQTYLTLNTAG